MGNYANLSTSDWTNKEHGDYHRYLRNLVETLPLTKARAHSFAPRGTLSSAR